MLLAAFGVKQHLKPFLSSTYPFQCYTDIVLSNYSIITSAGWSHDGDDTNASDSSHEASMIVQQFINFLLADRIEDPRFRLVAVAVE